MWQRRKLKLTSYGQESHNSQHYFLIDFTLFWSQHVSNPEFMYKCMYISYLLAKKVAQRVKFLRRFTYLESKMRSLFLNHSEIEDSDREGEIRVCITRSKCTQNSSRFYFFFFFSKVDVFVNSGFMAFYNTSGLVTHFPADIPGLVGAGSSEAISLSSGKQQILEASNKSKFQSRFLKTNLKLRPFGKKKKSFDVDTVLQSKRQL